MIIIIYICTWYNTLPFLIWTLASATLPDWPSATPVPLVSHVAGLAQPLLRHARLELSHQKHPLTVHLATPELTPPLKEPRIATLVQVMFFWFSDPHCIWFISLLYIILCKEDSLPYPHFQCYFMNVYIYIYIYTYNEILTMACTKISFTL
jgi:hypothetical protein